MAAEPKHRLISRALLAEIAAGKFAPSGRLPSETQLVTRFGVSRPTAARALRDLQEQGLIDRRVGSGSYVSTAAGRSREVDQRQLGLLIPGFGTTEIFERISGELAGLARVHDYGLLWGGSAPPTKSGDMSVQEAERWCDQFIEQRVSGVFFAPFEHVAGQDEVNRRLAEKLRQAGIAIVLLDRDLGRFPSRSDWDLVGIDNFAAGYLVAQHLLKLGSRRLAFVARPQSAATVNARVAGAREAIADHGLPVPSDFVRVGEPDDRAFAHVLARADRVDAVICANGHVAAMLLRSFGKEGVTVPRDIKVTGFDDVRFATSLSVPLTTVHQPCPQIALVAFRTMLERIADPAGPARAILLTPALVIRESCGAYLAAKGYRK